MTSDLSRLRIGVSALVALVGVAIGVGGTSAFAASMHSTSALALLGVFSADPSAKDAFPLDGERPYGEGMGLIYESSRYLGESDAAKFWVVQDNENRICLAALLLKSRAVAFGCVSGEKFARNGISTMAMVDDEYIEAYFVPDSLAMSNDVEGLLPISANLVVGDSRNTNETIDFTVTDERGITAATVHVSLVHPDGDG